MLLIENTEPCVRTVGPIILIPGMNRIDPDQWETLQHDYGKPVDELIEQGVLAINKTTRPTVGIVKKTYSIKLLQEWLDSANNAKGPVRKAIVDQLKLLTDPVKKYDKDGDGDELSAGDA